MIDINKKYTYNGKPVRIYADGSDTFGNIAHGAYLDKEAWSLRTFLEHELVEVWEPEEGELCFFWDTDKNMIPIIAKFKEKSEFNKLYFESSNNSGWDNCAPFKGELPEAFKGLQQ